MKCGNRFFVAISIALFTIFLTLLNIVTDRWEQYRGSEYVSCQLRGFMKSSSCEPKPSVGEVGDKVIVMAKMEDEDTSWVEDYLGDWQRAIYTVNPSANTPADTLVTPLNKGHEAMAYLTYVIDNYDKLASTIVFLHSHRSGFLTAWHVDSPMHDNVWAMQHLQLDFVQENGYVNLRCNWNPGCTKAQRKNNKHITWDVWQELFTNTSTPPAAAAADSDSETGEKKAMYMPTEVGAACCAQFAVSKKQVQQRPKDDYIQFRRWVIETKKDDAHSGRVMEYIWHVIFGKNAV
ncbi:MAG: hypothetical protein M1834_003328 [Cirrosporium novae-zelandiae]|nr:MAG: hypothetical protein M1834_003328 [Cirrosporium novae-zelandiae]